MHSIDEIVKKDSVQTFLRNYRKVLETRSIVGAELTIPEEFLGIIREDIEKYSKLYKYMTVRTVKGRGRIAVMGTVPEAIWTEACGALTELSINMTGIEVAEWKVGGYVSVCNATLEDSDIDLANEILRVIGGAIGYAIDKTAIYGTGVREPKGVALGKTAASITGNGAQLLRDIIKASGDAKSKYSNGRKVWLMNPDTLDTIRSQSIYAAGTGIVSGILDSVETFDFIPDNEIIVGYFDLYLLADRGDIRLKRTTDKQFVKDHTLLLGAARIDGVPVIQDAFTVIDFTVTDDPTPGGSPTPITITENGTYTRGDGYSPVTVNVPSVEPTGSINITRNGSHDVTNYATALVSVGEPIVFYDGNVTVSNGQFTITSTQPIVDEEGVVDRGMTLDMTGSQNAKAALFLEHVRQAGWNSFYTAPVTAMTAQIRNESISQITLTTTLPDGTYHATLTESVDKYAPATVTANGSHDVTNKSIVKVNVPGPTGKITITQNATNIDVAQYATADVAVPEPYGTLDITENGEYDVTDYVTAKVATPVPTGSVQITQNGTHTVAGYAEAEVNVPVDDTLGKLLAGTLEDYTNENVTSLNSGAFYNALGTATLNFPNVTHIGATKQSMPGSTFFNYDGDIVLSSIRGLIGGKNFMGSGIKAVHWENWGVDTTTNHGIGSQEFSGCKSLESVYIDGSNAAVNLGGCQVGYAAFQNCTSLHTVELKKTNAGGNYDIASSAFSGCSSLTKLVLDSSGTIYKWNLAAVNALQGTPIASGTGYVYVPDDLVDSYKTDTNWVTYADQIKPISELA